MKKTLLLSSFTLVVLRAVACLPSESYYDYADWGKLQLVGNQLSSKDGSPVQLRGWTNLFNAKDTLDCSSESQCNLMRQYGANVVRLAIEIEKENGYLSNTAKIKDFVKQSIKETAELNMYCIVDWHILPDSQSKANPIDYINESMEFFGEVSKYCLDNGYDHVLYEICNEAICDSWLVVKSYAEQVIPVILRNQPEAMIIVGTNNWSQSIIEPVSNPVDSKYKNNVLYSFHYYACSHYSLLGDFRFAQTEIPVFASEWSALKFDRSGSYCRSNSDDFIHACGKYDTEQLVSWCVWSWRSSDESSFLTGTCEDTVLSQTKSRDDNTTLSDYVRSLMYHNDESHDWTSLNKIPSVSAVESDAVDFSISPNPTSGEFTITLADNVEATVEVVNMAGQVVLSLKIEKTTIVSNPLPSGVYTVIVKSNGGVSTQKLLVK